MTVSKKQQAHVTAYVKAHYDRISLTVKQGKLDQIRAVDEAMERDVPPK